MELVWYENEEITLFMLYEEKFRFLAAYVARFRDVFVTFFKHTYGEKIIKICKMKTDCIYMWTAFELIRNAELINKHTTRLNIQYV